MTPENKILTKRQIKALETRHKLLDSAISLFACNGFDNVTIEDITHHAGTSKGAFYNHFKSKQDVVLARFQELDEANYEFYEKAMQKKGAMDRMATYLSCVTDYTMNMLGMDLVRVVYINQVSAEHQNKFFFDEKRPSYTLMDELIKEGQTSGELRKDLSSMSIAKMLNRLLNSWTYEWCVHRGGFNLTREMNKHLSLIMSILSVQ